VIAGGTLRTKGPLPEFGFAPTWSPDGRSLAFAGTVDGRLQIFLTAVPGGRVRAVPGTRGGFAPVFAPDGRTIAFARARIRSHIGLPDRGPPKIWSYASVTTWTITIDGSNPRRLTPWRNGLEVMPSSFSPDGTILAASRFDERVPHFDDAIALRTDGSGTSLLAASATRPAFSPDGSRIALITYLPRVRPRLGRHGFYRGGLTVMSADGTESKFLARTTFNEQSPPGWDPSGERLAYTERTSILEINVDGTCRRKIFAGTPDQLYFGPTWQPGREAGEIDC
jgi:Tol biopolymer transport system component